MKRALGIFAAAAAVGLLATAGGALWAWRTLERPLGPTGREVIFRVPEGAPAVEILRDLEAAGLISDALLARLYLVYRLEDPPLLAGEYRFDEPLATPEVLDRLIRGRVIVHPVTLLEGLTLTETAEALAEAGFGDRDTFVAEMSSPARIADLDPVATDLEGYLFPDTYRFARGTPETEIVDTLVETFRRHFEAMVEKDGLPMWTTDRRAVVTLASIVEKEAGLDRERPMIAGVYVNRLERGIGLYADPTVIYALKKLGRWDGNLRRPDLAMDSPYNTYKVRGLPPGPICSPGEASLAAALAPATVPYLYFVSRNDGSHEFAATLAEHNRNVERWQRRYWRERWARERAVAEADSDDRGDRDPD